MKSTDHTWLAATASGSGWRTRLRFRPRLRRSGFSVHVQPVHPLVVYLPAFALQQNLQTAVAEPSPGLRQLAQTHAQWPVFAPAFPIATRRTIQFHQPTGPSLAQLQLTAITSTASRRACGLTTATTAFNALMSTACSATMCFGCRFLPPAASAKSRLAQLQPRRTCSSTGRNTPSQSRADGTALRFHPGLRLLRNGDDLIFAESTLPHVLLWPWRVSHPKWEKSLFLRAISWGAGQLSLIVIASGVSAGSSGI